MHDVYDSDISPVNKLSLIARHNGLGEQSLG